MLDNSSMTTSAFRQFSRQLLTAAAPAAAPHKHLTPVAAGDVIFFVLAFLVLSLAAGAGIGGGVLLVPMLSLIHFGPIQSAALSNIAIVSGALVNMVFNLPRKNPLRPGPVIDYDLLLLLGPPVIMGAVGGSYLNMVIPGPIITRVLVLAVLLPMMHRMVIKARVLFRQETSQRKAAAATAAAAGKAGAASRSPSLQSLSSFNARHGPAEDADGPVFHHTELSTVIESKSCHGGRLAAKAAALAAAAAKEDDASDKQPATNSKDVERADGLPPVSAFAACPSQQHHRQHKPQHQLHHQHSASPAHSTNSKNSRELVRSLSRSLSHGLHEAAHLSRQSSMADAFGPELIYVSDSYASDKAGAIGRALSRRLSRRHSSSVAPGGAGDKESNGKDIVINAGLNKGKDVAVSPLPQSAVSACKRRCHTDCLHTPDLDDAMAGRIQREESAQLPPMHLALLLLLLATVSAASVCAQELLPCGSPGYFAVVLLLLPIMLVVWAFVRHHVLKKAGWKQHLPDLCRPSDIAWTPLTTIAWPAVCISAGIVAGLLGLGGGVILAPVMLEMHVAPQTAAATSQATLLISSCSSSIVYALNGSMPWDYGIVMIIIGLTGTLFGQVVVNWVVQKTGRSSILVIVLAIMFVLACFAAAAALAVAIASVVHNPALLTTARHVCIK